MSPESDGYELGMLETGDSGNLTEIAYHLKSKLSAGNLDVEIRDLDSLGSSEDLFSKFGGECVMNLLLIASHAQNQSWRRLQDWLREFLANDDDSEDAARHVSSTNLRNFNFQVLGIDSASEAVVYCASAIELDRLLASASCRRYASMYSLTSQETSLKGYVASLTHTLGMSPAETRDGQLAIFYASWSHTSKTFAYELREILLTSLSESSTMPLKIDVLCLGSISVEELATQYATSVLLISSYTYGQIPSAALDFWNELQDDHQAGRERLVKLSFAILGLGDSTYFADCFCKAAYDLESLLLGCGAGRIIPLATCDQTLGQQPLQFRLWATSIFANSLKRHLSVSFSGMPSASTLDPQIKETPEPLSGETETQTGGIGISNELQLSMLPVDEATVAHPTLLILYGTQSGNSERFAWDLKSRLRISGNTVCMDAENFRPQAVASPALVVFVVATYGDGEPPESCAEFFQLMQNDKQFKSFFSNISYCIVALGSSAYPNFCGFGTKLNKVLKNFGATRKLPMIKLDDTRDMDADFSRWFESRFEKVATEVLGTASQNPSTVNPALRFTLIPNQHPTRRSKESTVCPSSALSKDIFKSSTQYEIVDCRVFGSDYSSDETNRRNNYEVTIRTTKSLNEKEFYPGSTFAFYPEIDSDDAQWLLDSLFEWQGLPASRVEGDAIIFQGGPDLPSTLPQGVSLREVIASLTDFGETPSSQWLQETLLPHLPLTHPYVVNKEFQVAIDKHVANTPLTTLEVLRALHQRQAFRLPLDFLLLMRRQLPRQYTVASAVDRDAGVFRLIISESVTARNVPNQLANFVPSLLVGLVSGMLRKIRRTKSTRIIRGLPKRALFGPETWKCGGVWVASGSGIAPFIGFIEQRRREGLGSFGRTILFFGCRSSNPRDFAGNSTILEAVRDGYLEMAYFAFSREYDSPRANACREASELSTAGLDRLGPMTQQSTPQQRVHVQVRIAEEMNSIRSILKRQPQGDLPGKVTYAQPADADVLSKICICGSAEMGKAVLDVLSTSLSPMSLENRIIMEVW
eukprot:Gregarina_sp_Poly_1__1588@NODE_1400_length_4218_cov_58_285955_g41_i1_p1_GENE_NODE_1400_length_4218_cov_58_285955_g41_i1NODE_1400_length_4218_cov_58_285955_g41_i1_p1_ORF_typecomplete_len1186_score191_69Flavodoxin_1/PF00258_25/4_1e05Flavodoxin_1/PF00258_25/1_4e17Flavodoxin_1/PF00258_25/2_1e29NAD_binding_1/PF00175_21/4_2e08FAD_binding_1/PF00667_20/6_4e07Flavodoxin_5/PF12724_7/3_7e02Flavodoxin_5/PF12724_7/1_3e02Flavodoxin_5/PF12724_7/0_012DUF515/PF04415_12/0_06Flavodoxin_3/PF12641_7/2_1e03Flavodoxin